MASYDDLNGKKLALVSIFSIVMVAVAVLAVQVVFFAMAEYVDSKKIEQATYTRSLHSLAQQAEEVGSYGVDPDTGNITIPVEEVMKKMASEAINEST